MFRLKIPGLLSRTSPKTCLDKNIQLCHWKMMMHNNDFVRVRESLNCAYLILLPQKQLGIGLMTCQKHPLVPHLQNSGHWLLGHN